VLIAIVKKELGIKSSLYTLLQILSISVFEKMPILQALSMKVAGDEATIDEKQLTLLGL
jgi:hypothetical protein